MDWTLILDVFLKFLLLVISFLQLVISFKIYKLRLNSSKTKRDDERQL